MTRNDDSKPKSYQTDPTLALDASNLPPEIAQQIMAAKARVSEKNVERTAPEGDQLNPTQALDADALMQQYRKGTPPPDRTTDRGPVVHVGDDQLADTEAIDMDAVRKRMNQTVSSSGQVYDPTEVIDIEAVRAQAGLPKPQAKPQPKSTPTWLIPGLIALVVVALLAAFFYFR